MSETASEILQRLTAAGLVPEDLAQELASAAELAEPASFVDDLSRRGLLTPYQAHAALSASTPLVLGEYVLLDRLGKGGMGIVYKARHRRMHRLAAVKVLSTDLVGTPEGEQRFYREARAIARLDHPNIAHAYDASEDHGLHYLVMELVEGRDLAGVVADHGPMALGEALDAVRQAALALACAHEAGIIHRDVKPANLLRSPDGRVKLLDLGIARLREPGPAGSETLTQTGWLLGSVPYMAPEHAEDPRAADHRSDIFSLGCTLHVLLTGRLPFDGTTTVKQILAAREQPTPDLREVLPRPARGAALLDELQALFARMVAKNPKQRTSTMAEVAAEAEALLQRAPAEVLALRSAGLPPEIEPAPAQRPAPHVAEGTARSAAATDQAEATRRMARPSGSRSAEAPSRPSAQAPPAGPAAQRGAIPRAPARPASPTPPPAPPRRLRARTAWLLAGLVVAALALATWGPWSRTGAGHPDGPSIAASAPSPEAPTVAAPAPLSAATPADRAALEVPLPATSPGIVPAATAPPPRPPTARRENLLSVLGREQLGGWSREPDGTLAAAGGSLASLTASYVAAPGYVLALSFEQSEGAVGPTGSALRVQFVHDDGVAHVLELDRHLPDGRIQSRVGPLSRLDSDPEAGPDVLHEGRLLEPGVAHFVEIEVHPSALIVRIDDAVILADGKPGGPPPEGAATRRNGSVAVATSLPTILRKLDYSPMAPPGGMESRGQPPSDAPDDGLQARPGGRPVFTPPPMPEPRDDRAQPRDGGGPGGRPLR